ncbi:FKBP-type peptidyl-prolyl cis-trans isomerase [Massilia cavernae]|uniref:peptidylprolyl isomerase n=1 Tax=Massilia cavernae TaxID=2320864 RepID=A0A418XQ33_9BURK|nr:FKBP-type peptidyl-prolyl cis-trans isomerase [Massilia cavernae]RJG14558.1 DUF4214 domain-containing protein [Massilia cavernae]
MTKPIKYAALCSLSLLLAACGSDSATDAPATTATASRVSAQTSQVEVSAYHDVVQRIYVGYFGRPADAGGLAFFAGRFRDLGAPTNIADMSIAYGNNADIRALIDVFGTSAESQALYAGDNSVFIDAIYSNLFGRAADQVGKDFWTDAINKATSRGPAPRSRSCPARRAPTPTSSPRRLWWRAASPPRSTRRSVRWPTTAWPPTSSCATCSARWAVHRHRRLPGQHRFHLGHAGGPAWRAGLLRRPPDRQRQPVQLTGTGKRPVLGLLRQRRRHRRDADLLPAGPGQLQQRRIRRARHQGLRPGPASAAAVSSQYSPLASLNGSITVGGSSIPFTSTGFPESGYVYNTPARLSEVAGSYRMSGTLGVHNTTIAADGSFNASLGACNYSGRLTPRASGKNVFDASWTFGAGTCPLSGQTGTGVALSYIPVAGGTRLVTIAVTNAARTTGTIMASLPPALAALGVTDTVAGAGAEATNGKVLTVNYTGWLYNPYAADKHGAQFDTSIGKTPFVFRLGNGNVIKGWDQGMVGMKVGGKRILAIPSSLGYGAMGSGSIPPNSDLIFEVELISVN